LSTLTQKEKEIFITVVGHNVSFSKCAALHGVKRHDSNPYSKSEKKDRSKGRGIDSGRKGIR
ncbi:hypothetical protein, partial [Burkholderia sp. SIMBA_024]|uniref:hypothetical protein n=1 Tax=Burkholderia sp. SIMBA_024 TaxID=3085768 RepID=UPI0039780276